MFCGSSGGQARPLEMDVEGCVEVAYPPNQLVGKGMLLRTGVVLKRRLISLRLSGDR